MKRPNPDFYEIAIEVNLNLFIDVNMKEKKNQ